MAKPGWYPDPEGGETPRYWDGTSWASQPDRSPRSRTGMIGLGVGLLTVLVVVAVVILQPWRGAPWAGAGEDTRSARPTGSQWDELPPPSTTPPPDEDKDQGGQTVECPLNSDEQRSQIQDGRIAGGGLSFEARRDWQRQNVWMPWLYDHNSQIRTITSGWMSNLSVGYVKTEEGFLNPRQTARSLMACLASSDLYQGFTGREDLTNEVFSLDGRHGWRITSNVLVDRSDVRGDVVDIVVLDLGREGQLSVWISCATIDDQKNLDEVREAFESLRVDG